jgi:fumarylacetoacetase
MDALEPFRVASPEQNPKPLPYLQQEGNRAFDIQLEVAIQPENVGETVVSRSNFKYMYWTMAQQLAHHTSNGCRVNSGDMMGSGTISGPTEDSFGSMLELTWGGKNPLTMQDGRERKFINDNDTVIIRGYCKNEAIRIGFGECSSKLLPAFPLNS